MRMPYLTILLVGSGLGLMGCSPSPLPNFSFDNIDLDPMLGEFPLPNSAPLNFPQDHFAHPEQRGERWAITMQFADENQRFWVGQVAFVRISLMPDGRGEVGLSPQPALASHTLQWGHMSFTADNGEWIREQRLSRAAAGLAGYEHGKGWVEDWQWTKETAADSTMRWRVNLVVEGQSLNFDLTPSASPIALENADGTPTPVRGYWQSFELQGHWGPKIVTGTALLEHGWGRLPLNAGQQRSHRVVMQTAEGEWFWFNQQERRDGSRGQINGFQLTAAGPQPLERLQGEFRRRQAEFPIEIALSWNHHQISLHALHSQPVSHFPLQTWLGGLRVSGTLTGIAIGEWTGY